MNAQQNAQTGLSRRDRGRVEIALLKEMVAIPSPSGQEAALAAYLVECMQALGLHSYRDAVGNAIGILGDGPRTLLLLGHMDTVSGLIPFRQEGDRLYGRGTVDAKGSLAAFIAAVARVGPLPGWRIIVVGAVEEESTTSRGARHLFTTCAPPDGCIIGEPSGWDRITIGYKGSLVADVQLRLPLVHTAGPTDLPAERAVALWNDIVHRCVVINAGRCAFERLDPSLRHVTTHDAGAYGIVRMTVGFRLPPDRTPAGVTAELRDWIAAFGLAVRGPDRPFSDKTAAITVLGGELAYRAPKNTPLVRAFLTAIRKQGGRPRFVRKSGTSDMNLVGPIWRCPIVAYGPGDATLDHTPHEHLDLSEYRRAIDVLECALRHVGKGMDG